jgi:heptosyltransferase I
MRILIIKLSSLGDVFHALPAVRNLKVELNASIDWVTTSAYVDLVSCFDDVDNVIGFPRNHFFKHFREFRASLRQRDYDMVIDLQGLLKSSVVARLARSKQRIGPSFHREGSRLFYTSVAGARNKDRHAVLENLDIIRHLELEEHAPVFPVSFPTPSIPLPPSPRVAICSTSRWPSKNWPLDRFAAVAKELQQSLNASIVLLGGPDEIDVCHQIEAALPKPCTNLAGKTKLPEMGGILKAMDLLIANDSGPVHMSAAVGTQALVVFGPTNPDRTGPFGDIHRVIKTAFPCQPCHRRTCEKPDMPCINGVKVFNVVAAAKEMLQSTEQRA